MDEETKKILKRQSDRRRQLASEREGGVHISSDVSKENRDVASPPPKRLSVGSDDVQKPMRSPQVRATASPIQGADDNITVSVKDEQSEIATSQPGSGKPQMGLRSRWANLASQVDDFECDSKFVPICNRPKEDFMRGPAPRMSMSAPAVAPGGSPSSSASSVVQRSSSTGEENALPESDSANDTESSMCLSVCRITCRRCSYRRKIVMGEIDLRYMSLNDAGAEKCGPSTEGSTTSSPVRPPPCTSTGATTLVCNQSPFVAVEKAADKHVVDDNGRAAVQHAGADHVRLRPNTAASSNTDRQSIADIKAMWENRMSREISTPNADKSKATSYVNRTGTVSFPGDAKRMSDAEKAKSGGAADNGVRSTKAMWMTRTNDPSPIKTPSQKVPAAPPMPKSFATPVVAPQTKKPAAPVEQSNSPARQTTPSEKSAAALKPQSPIVKGDDGSGSKRKSLVPGDPQRAERMAKLRDRWEVSSSMGKPLNPDVHEANDELLHAAAQMQRAHVRQMHLAIVAEEKQQQSRGAVEQKPVARNVTIKDSVEYIEPSDDGLDNDTADPPDNEDLPQRAESPSSEPEDLPYPADIPDPEPYPADVSDSCPEDQNMDQLIDDVFHSIDGESTQGSHTASSRSLAMAHSAAVTHQSPSATATDTSSCVDDPPHVLAHSVSFYRREQQQRASQASSCATPVQVRPAYLSTRSDVSCSTTNSSTGSISSAVDSHKLVQYIDARIKKLNEAATIETRKIEQASKALHVAQSRSEFRDSREEVEAKRALLLAIETRRSQLQMVERYLSAKRERRLPAGEAPGPKGTLTMSNITVPLRREFVNTHYNQTHADCMYYFVALVKHAEIVLHTELVTSDEALQRTNLEFPNMLTLHQLSHDFKLRIEFFYLKARRNLVPHDTKYGLGNSSTMKSRTLSGIFGVSHASPAGPHTVGDPSFQQCGMVELDIKSIARGKFALQGTHNGPIDSTCIVKIRCFAESVGDVEQHGFLNVYEEVSGISSWQRYWCVLRDGALHFWRFPDDVDQRPAVATIDLTRCSNEQVRQLSTDHCTRAHSFRLDIMPDPAANDSRRKESKIVLAADDRTSFESWTGKINDTFGNLHMWRPKSDR